MRGERGNLLVAVAACVFAVEKLRKATTEGLLAMADSTRRCISPVRFELQLRWFAGCFGMRSSFEVVARWEGEEIMVLDRFGVNCG